jgi:hypothetical protein
VIGRTGGERMRIAVDGRQLIDVTVAHAEDAWAGSIGRHFVRRVA